MFDHSHFKSIDAQSQNCSLKNFLSFGEKHVPQSAQISVTGRGGQIAFLTVPKYTRFFLAWGSPQGLSAHVPNIGSQFWANGFALIFL